MRSDRSAVSWSSRSCPREPVTRSYAAHLVSSSEVICASSWATDIFKKPARRYLKRSLGFLRNSLLPRQRPPIPRSEERRVGKERRSGGSRQRYKEKDGGG